MGERERGGRERGGGEREKHRREQTVMPECPREGRKTKKKQTNRPHCWLAAFYGVQ